LDTNFDFTGSWILDLKISKIEMTWVTWDISNYKMGSFKIGHFAKSTFTTDFEIEIPILGKV
jgi:hypothetical protein